MNGLVTRTGAWIGGIAVAFTLIFASAAAAGPVEDAQKTEVTIPAGEIVLAATLYRPAGATGNLPAVVLGHGSGKVNREMNRFWINASVATGVAVLVYDKRGTGSSTGTFLPWELEETPALFQTLAADMAHAVRWLAKQEGIDRERIGLMGGSQAGWIMPLAASQEPLVKFVIIGEGVPLPAGIEEAHGYYLDNVSKEGEGNPSLRHVAAADALVAEYAGESGFDPAPVLEGLTIPVLWIFGLYDGVIPVRMCIDRIGQLHKAGKTNHAIHIFPFGNHNFQNVFTRERYSVPDVSREWLKKIGIQR